MNIKNKKIIVAAMALLTLASCGNKENSNDKPDTQTPSTEENISESTSDEKESTEDVSTESESNETSNTETETSTENTTSTETSSNNEEQASGLTAENKDVIDQLVKKMEDFENGTAGSSLKVDIILTDFINNASFLNDNLDEAKEYFSSKSSEVENVDNFNLTLDALKAKADSYKDDKDSFMQEIEASGSKWDPQTSIENFQKFLDI